jgi:hypothetical protein
LPHNPNFFAHCPISCGRRKPLAESTNKQTIFNYACKHDYFLKRVLIERQELYKNDELACNNPFRKLILTKRAMHTVAKGIDRQKQENKLDSAEDRIGNIMSFIRAAEEIDLPKMRRSSKLCPIICQHVNPLDPNAREKAGMDELRNLVVRLAREKIPRNAASWMTTTQKTIQKKTNAQGQLKRKTSWVASVASSQVTPAALEA